MVAGSKRKTRWPLLSPVLLLRRLKPASGGASEKERVRERSWNTNSPGLVRMWIFIFLQSCVPLSLFPKIFKTQCCLHHFLPNFIPSFQPSLLSFFLPSFHDSFLWCPKKYFSSFSPFNPSLCPFIFLGLVWNRESNTIGWRHQLRLIIPCKSQLWISDIEC